ncbi:MAG: hypothetical protein LUO96_06590 [Methanomicrobiales archaeon]|nr:hypothetical protein [Methanomicrobiales archaeon]
MTLNLTAELERLITHLAERVSEFSHIDPARVLVCIATTRGGGIHGTYAKIHPLCFAGGSKTTTIRRGRHTYTCTMPTVSHRGEEMRYVIYFLSPRFFDLPFREKLITVFHELYHISPAFDGDIRRFPGRNYAHGTSTKRYNALMASMVDTYLAGVESRDHLAFLEGAMETLRQRSRALVGRRMTAPKIKVTRSPGSET